MTATMTATTAQVAADLNTTPRTLRKFLRSQDQGVGKGSRYALPANKAALNTMRKQFAAWSAEVEAAKAAKVEAIEVDEVDTELDDEGDADDE